KWAHAVELRPFSIARAPVTQQEFAAFVEDGGYRDRRFWSDSGWRWREKTESHQPVYWQREAGSRWLRRDYDRWVPLEPHRPVVHVNWYEAEAYCRWARRRLPTEVEWEAAAASNARGAKRRFPWGDSSPTPRAANLDGPALGCMDVGALADGD